MSTASFQHHSKRKKHDDAYGPNIVVADSGLLCYLRALLPRQPARDDCLVPEAHSRGAGQTWSPTGRLQRLCEKEATERFTLYNDAGRRIFRQPPIYRSSTCSVFDCRWSAWCSSCRRVSDPHQFRYLGCCVCCFLYVAPAVFGTIRSTTHRRKMVRVGGVNWINWKNRCAVVGALVAVLLLFRSGCCATILYDGDIPRGMRRTWIPSATSQFSLVFIRPIIVGGFGSCVRYAAPIFRAQG